MTTRSSASPRRRRLLRAVRARRRWFAALLAAAAVAFALDAVAPAAAPSVSVVVAAGDLAPGVTLEASDLRSVAWPTALVPPGALAAIPEAVGRTLAGALGSGELVTTLRLVGPTLAATLLSVGRVAAPVRLADAEATRLLRPGDRIDLVSASAGSADPIAGTAAAAQAHVVAAGATVVAVPASSQGSSLIGSAGTTGGALLVVAVTRSEALALAQASVLGPLSVILVG